MENHFDNTQLQDNPGNSSSKKKFFSFLKFPQKPYTFTSLKSVGFFLGVFALASVGISVGSEHIFTHSTATNSIQQTSQAVLGAAIQAPLQGTAVFNIPAEFNEEVTFAKGLNVNGTANLNGPVVIKGKKLDLGNGTITASNVVYSVSQGSGIQIANGQNPTITNTGVLSFQGKTGDVTLAAGTGISISGTTISSTQSQPSVFGTISDGTNSFSAGSTNDTLTFLAGTGVTITTDTANKKLTINAPSAAGLSGLTTNGVLYATSATTATTLAPGTSGFILQSNGNSSAPSWIPPSSLSTVGFDKVTTGINTSNTLTVGNASLLTFSGSGIVNANEFTGQAVSLAGPLTTSGAFGLTFTLTGATSLTLPTAGTLATLAGNEVLTNKTISAASNTISGLTNANLSGAAGITNANLANSSLTVTAGSGLSGGGLVSLGGSVTLTNAGVTSLTGTANQVTVSGSTGAVTLSLPQSIAITSTPTFGGETLTGNLLLPSSGGIGGYLQLISGALSPTNITNDFLVGGSSTPSAKLQISGTTGNIAATGTLTGLIGLSSSGTINFSGLTASSVVFTDGSKNLTSSGTVGVSQGGTGISSYSSGDLLYANGATSFTRLGITGSGNVLVSNGSSPTWTTALTGLTGLTSSGAIDFSALTTNGVLQTTGGNGTLGVSAVALGSEVSGTLPLTNGGTAANLSGSAQGGVAYFTGSALGVSIAGTTGQCLVSNGTSAPSWTVCASGSNGINYWNLANGTLAPINTTLDLLIGGTATSSANFAFINSATPVASIGGTLSLDGSGNIQTARDTSLTLGGVTTGNIALTPLNGSGTVTINGSLAIASLTTGLAHVNSTGGISSTALNLAGGVNEVTGTLPVGNGGTGATTLTGILKGNGTGAFTAVNGTTNYVTYWSDANTIAAEQFVPLSQGGTGANLSTGAQTGGISYYNGTTLALTGSGTSGQCLTGGTTPTWSNCAQSTNWFTQSNGAIYPINTTLDFLLGGTATTSAKFAFLNVNSGTPTATIGGVLSFDANGNIQTTNDNTLTLGSATTGNIALLPQNGTGTVSITGGLSVSSTINLSSLTGSKVVFTDSSKNLTTTGTVGVAQGGTGQTSFTTNGVLYGNNTSGLLVTAAGTSGQVLIANSFGVPVWGSVSGGSGGVCSDCVINDPTATQTIAPTGQGTVGLSVAQTSTASPTNDIFNVTNSGGSTKFFEIDKNGNVTFGGISTTGIAHISNTGLLSSSALNLAGGANEVTGILPLTNGGTAANLSGSAQGGVAYFTGSALGVSAAGTTGQCLVSNGTSAPSWLNCASGASGTNWWNVNNGVLFPINTTLDLVIGGSSTSSANFAFINSATPVASIGGTLSLDGSGNIQTARDTSLTLGGATTGNISLLPQNGSGSVSVTGSFSVSGTVNLSGLTASKVVFTDSSKNLTTTGTVGVAQGGTGVATFGGTNTLLFTTTANTLSSISNGTTGQYLRAITGGAPAFATILSSEISNSDFLVKVPGSTVANTIAPTVNSVVGLTVKGTTGTAANVLEIFNSNATPTRQSYFDQNGAFNTSQAIVAPTFSNTINGIVINSGALSSVSTLNLSGAISGATSSNTINGIVINSSALSSVTTLNLSGAITGATSSNTINGLIINGSTQTLSANAISDTGALTVSTGGNGNLTLTAAGSGNTILSSDANSGVLIGSSSNTLAPLSISGGIGSNASLIDNNTNNGDLFTASASAATKFTINNNGNIAATGTLTGLIGLSSSGTINFSGLTASSVVFTDGSKNLTSSGTVGVSQGGTGISSYSSGDLLYANGATSFTRLGITGSGNVLVSNGSSPTWTTALTGLTGLTSSGAIDFSALTTNGVLQTTGGNGTLGVSAVALGSEVSGTLPVGNGGLGADVTPAGAGELLYSTSGSAYGHLTAGTTGYCLTSGGAGVPSWQPCATGSSGVNYWQLASGALSPINSTTDLLVGGTATSSAKFAFINVSSGTPTASISAGLAGAAYINASGTLATTNKQTLTLGDGNTGNINFFNNANFLTSTGNLTLGGNITAGTYNGNTITSGTGTLTLASKTLTVNNSLTLAGADGKTITFGGNNLTFTTSADTSLTLPTSGTLATLAGTEALTNKTINGLTPTTQADGFTIAGGTTSRTLTVTGADITIGSTIQPTSPGALTVNSNGANALTLDSGTTGNVNLGIGNNAKTINIGTGTAGNTINIGTDNTTADTITIGSAKDSLALSSAHFVVSAAGAVSGVTTLNLSGAITGAISSNTINGLIINSATQTLSANSFVDAGALSIGTGSNGNLTLTPNGTGKTILTSTATSGVLIGSSSNTLAPLSISGGIGSNASLIDNNTNNGDLFTASASAATKFTINNNGNIAATGTLTGLIGLTSSGAIDFSALTTNGVLQTTGGNGTLGVSAVALGSEVSGTLPVGNGGLGANLSSGAAIGDLLYADSTSTFARLADIASGSCLISGGVGVAPSWSNCPGGANYWTINSGTIYPVNSTLDLLVGGTSTSSAKFAFLNVNSGTPTASISGTLALAGDGTIQTTNYKPLTLGGSTTGPIQLSPKGTTGLYIDGSGNVGIGTTSPSTLFTVAGSTALIGANGLTSDLAAFNDSNGTPIQRFTALGGIDQMGLLNTPYGGIGQYENRITYSQQFTNGAWASFCQFPATNTDNTTDIQAPDGTFTANKSVTHASLGCSGAADGYIQSASGGLTTGQPYTVSIWMRGLNGNEKLSFGVNDNNEATNITLTKTWKRYTYTTNALSADTTRGVELSFTTSSGTYYLWGAQLEKRNYPGVYIATTGSAFIQSYPYASSLVVNATGSAYFAGNVIAGSVGIGTTSPSNLLEIANGGATTPGLRIYNGTERWQLGVGIQTANDAKFGIYDVTQGQNRLVIDSSGNITVSGTLTGLTGITSSGTINFSGLTASSVVFTDGSKNLTSSGTVGVSQGGTGISSYAVGDVLYANGTTSLTRLADVATGSCLISGGVGVAPNWGTCGNLWNSANGAIFEGNTTMDLLLGGTATSSADISFTNVVSGTPTMTLGIAGTSNGLIKLNSSGVGKTAPTIFSDSSGGLNLTAATGIVTVGNGSGDIVLDPGGSNLVANLSGNGSFLVEAAGATFITFDKMSNTTFSYPGTTTTAITVNGSSLTTGGDVALTGASSMTTANLLSLSSDTYVHSSAGETGKVINLAFTDNSTLNAAGTTQTIGLNVLPTFGATGTSGTHELYGAYFQSPTINSPTGTNNIYGVRISNQGGSGVTNAYGLYIDTPSGATNNYGAIIAGGNSGFGTTTPKSTLDVSGNVAIGTYAGSNAAPSSGLIVSGNVGIGTSGPGFMLDVKGNVSATAAAEIYNTNSTANSGGLIVKLGFTGNGTTPTSQTTGNNFIRFLDGNGDPLGSIDSNGGTGISYNSGGLDLAEYFPKKDVHETLVPGDTVCLDELNGVTNCTSGQSIIGVVSAHPSFVGGANHAGDPNYVLVGMIGQLPAKISTENGSIASGDPLTIASESGVLAKATTVGPIVGHAMQSSDEQDVNGQILIAVQPSWYDPSFVAGATNFPLGASTAASLVQNIQNMPLLTADTATISGTLNVLGRTTVTDLGITGNVNDGLITIHGLDGEIDTLAGDLKLQTEGLGGVDILNGLVTIDTSGNITTKAVLSAQTVKAQQYVITGGQSAGTASISAGLTSTTVTTNAMTPNSKVFITPNTLTTRQLTVTKKQTGKFTVGIETPDIQDIYFDWWIINTQ